jgi:hypothetical protein
VLTPVRTSEPDCVIFVTIGSDSDIVCYTVSASVQFIHSDTSMNVLFGEKLYVRLSKVLNGANLTR